MNKNWINDIRFTAENQKTELMRWCEIIGFDKYYEYYELVKQKYGNVKVPFGVLRECAIYDSHLCRELFCILKIIEENFRYKVIKVSEESLINDIGNIMTKEHQKKKIYKDYVNSKIKLYDYLQELTFGELNKVLVHLITSKALNILEKDVNMIKNLRNDIMHHKKVLNVNETLEDKIIFLLRMIEDIELRNKKRESINKLKKYSGQTVRNFVVDLSENK